MKPRHQVSRAAIDLIKRFEGYRRQAAELPDGRWTIGYGHTLTARKGAEVSEEDAEALLLYDLIAVAHSVNEWTMAPLTRNQFDALCAFAFNIGLDNFRRSGVLKRVNEGALIQAACAMEMWRKADFEGECIVVDGLVRRRSSEKTLFLTPPGGVWPRVPSALVRPVLDLDAAGLPPLGAPGELTAPVERPREELVREASPGAATGPGDADVDPGPVAAAAEAVTSRLQSLFPEAGEPETAEPMPRPEDPADLCDAPLQTPRAEPLTPSAPPGPLSPEAEPGSPTDEAEDARDLFAAPEAPEPEAPDPAEAEPEQPEPAASAPPPDLGFMRPRIEEEEDEGDAAEGPAGILAIMALGLLGLAFFGGGLFWAVNARVAALGGLVSPLAVGWLAGVAGVGFFAISVYLLLDRLGRAAQRPERRRRRR